VWLWIFGAVTLVAVTVAARIIGRRRVRRNEVQAAWRQVDAHLQHRHALARALMGVGAEALAAPLLTAESAREGAPSDRLAAERALGAAIDAVAPQLSLPAPLRADLESTARRLDATLRIHAVRAEKAAR
jgi:hypothetical protein